MGHQILVLDSGADLVKGGGGVELACMAFFGMPHTIYPSSETCLCVLKTMIVL